MCSIFYPNAFNMACAMPGTAGAGAKKSNPGGADGPVVLELKYREASKTPIITYHLAIDEGQKGPEVVDEWLQWRRGQQGPALPVSGVPPGHGQSGQRRTAGCG